MRRRWPEIAALLLYAAIVLLVTLQHEPWRDEADSWLLARDASVSDIFRTMPYAGTPALWYMVLLPFAKSGLPFLTQSLINNALMIAAVALLLFRSPLPRAVNVLAIFGYYPLFEYGVIARSYGLSVLLLVGALVLWKERERRPIAFAVLLGLLANTNTHSLLLALALAGAAFMDRRTAATPNGGRASARPAESNMSNGGRASARHDSLTSNGGRASARQLLAWVVFALLTALAMLQIRPPHDGNLAHAGRPVLPKYAPEAVSEAFLPLLDPAIGPWIAIALLVLITLGLFRRKPALLFFWGTTASLLALFVFVWVGGRRHYGFIVLAALAAFWIARSAAAGLLQQRTVARLGDAIAIAVLAWSCGAAMLTSYRDLVEPYSGAKEVAQFIRQRGLEQLPIAGHPAPQSEAILPYFDDKQMWYAGIERYGSYQRWDRQFEEGQRVSYPDAVARARRKFGRNRYLVLLNVEMPDPAGEGMILIFHNEDAPFGYSDERFWLYASRGTSAGSASSAGGR